MSAGSSASAVTVSPTTGSSGVSVTPESVGGVFPMMTLTSTDSPDSASSRGVTTARQTSRAPVSLAGTSVSSRNDVISSSSRYQVTW